VSSGAISLGKPVASWGAADRSVLIIPFIAAAAVRRLQLYGHVPFIDHIQAHFIPDVHGKAFMGTDPDLFEKYKFLI
jgi:hypothetical protein